MSCYLLYKQFYWSALWHSIAATSSTAQFTFVNLYWLCWKNWSVSYIDLDYDKRKYWLFVVDSLCARKKTAKAEWEKGWEWILTKIVEEKRQWEGVHKSLFFLITSLLILLLLLLLNQLFLSYFSLTKWQEWFAQFHLQSNTKILR
jgi:hypothetical protein